LNILKISSLPLATYLSGTENTKKYYEKTFFKEKIENITEMRFLDVHSKYGIVLLVNIDIPNEKPLTVFAIQGSIKKLDWWVDIEIFCSSAIFTFLNAISINQLESSTSKTITWLLTIPLRLLEKFTLFEKYINSLTYPIDKEIKKINGTRNILIAGHSLGGGLSKILGLKYHLESIAFSGPGITPLEYKFQDEIDYKYYKMNFIDVIPDFDVIPRIETTAGIRYRVLCNKGFFGCHSIERAICQIGATCRREDLTGDLCMSIFGEDYYNIRNLAGLKNEVPKEYQ
jgi:lipase ATG15